MKADAWMPLYVNDYLGATMRLTTEQHGAYLLLIMEGWKSGGVLPNDDEQLAAITKMTLKNWRKIAPNILRYFVAKKDGELTQARLTKEVEKARKISETRREIGAKGGRPRKQTESYEKPIGFENTPENPENEKQNESKPKHLLDVARPSPSSVPNGTAAEPLSGEPEDPLTELRALPIAKGAWRLAVKVLTERGKLTEQRARTFIGRLKGDGLSEQGLWEVAEATWHAETEDAVPYMAAAAERAVSRSGGTIDAPSERQQRAWAQDWAERGGVGWRTYERGPRPGEAGCRIAAAILAEFGIGERAA